MDNNSASVFDMFMLVMYLGSIVYLVSLFAFVLLINRLAVRLNTWCKVFVCIFKFLVSVFMSIFIWIYWPFEMDIMLGFVFIPGVLSEMIITVLVLIVMRRVIIVKNRQ